MAEFFDYIVIGAGSAGGLLASRLSEDSGTRVLLLEGGGTHKDLLVDMPSGWGQMVHDARYSWGHRTEPERYAGGRRIDLPRGKRLGGSSSINGMMYVRGDRSDYDSWATLGATGWSYDELLPHFVRTEGQCSQAPHFNQPWHGRNGPLTASDLPAAHPVSQRMVEAAVQAGLPHCLDFNDGHPDGAGLFQVNVRNGRRSSIARNAIEPAMRRANLAVRLHMQATRIQVHQGRACGVQWQDAAGGLHSAQAAREVLLCAGALQSPQLLMLSGIGPAAHLRELGIEMVRDLPGVGENLQDHAIVPMSWRLKAGTPSLNASLRGMGMLAAVTRYFLTRSGAMVMPASEFAAWCSSDPALPYRDIQIHGLPVTGDIEAFMRDGKTYRTEPFPGMTMAPYQVRPYSRGQLRLHSADPLALASVRMNYLHDERDRAALLHGIRITMHIARQPALAEWIEAQTRPGPDVQTDAELLGWLAQYLGSGHHASGTCRMGRADDPLAVVTPDLRVRGVDGLRVIDASVMPHLVSGNTNAASVVIGDKGADLVLGRPALPPLTLSPAMPVPHAATTAALAS